MYILLATILCFASIWDIIAITLNQQKKNNSVKWTVVSMLAEFTLFIIYLILGFYYKREPIRLNYIMTTVYAGLTIIRVICLFDIKKEEIEEQKDKN